jgi:hypothetical protein
MARSSSIKGLSNARLRTLNKVSDQVPTLRNVLAVPIDDILPFTFFIISPFVYTIFSRSKLLDISLKD